MNHVKDLLLPPGMQDYYTQLLQRITVLFSQSVQHVDIVSNDGARGYVFKLQFHDNTECMVKHFRTEKVKTTQQADTIIGFVLHLIKDSPVPAVALIPHGSGSSQPADYYFQYRDRFFYLEETHTDGIHKTRPELTDEQTIAYGRLIGHIHVLAAKRFPGTAQEYRHIRGWIPERELHRLNTDAFGRRMTQTAVFCSEELANIRQMIAFVCDHPFLSHVGRQVIMNDLNLGNVLFTEQGEMCALFDWDNLSYGCKIHDLMHPLTHTGKGYFCVEQLQRDTLLFLYGYVEVEGTTLSKCDFDHIHYFNLIELLVHLLFALQETDETSQRKRLRKAYHASWSQYTQLRNGLGIDFIPDKGVFRQRIRHALFPS
jgi:Ser/Thr protein kinase RdoA (MazF antagonist)